MAWDGKSERRRRVRVVEVERRGALWSTLGGLRMGAWDGWGELEPHPARLTPRDLDNPQGWRERLAAWLMKQH
ncbi:MAG TPA: hypothetical protein VJ505_12490 [Holophagaceae bacterium]|nr:hypothetical protein [Holophagaceae bacterium]